MAFLVRIEAIQRVSEYNGVNKQGEPYCIASWKVKNVSDNTIMLVSCFTKDDDILKNNPGFAMDATLSITCRDWTKEDKSGTMNNVNLTNIVGPEKIGDVPGQVGSLPIVNNSLSVPDGGSDLPF